MSSSLAQRLRSTGVNRGLEMEVDRSLCKRVSTQQGPGDIPGLGQTHAVAQDRNAAFQPGSQSIGQYSSCPPEVMSAATDQVTPEDEEAEGEGNEGCENGNVVNVGQLFGNEAETQLDILEQGVQWLFSTAITVAIKTSLKKRSRRR